ncbi:UvrD-helicase domain-containing protein [Niallia taxi]|uniref:UvrD-helicase domain-containing protein n=1 Tax=Niallia taxi TaxID=2499688 RepID=UPI002E23C9B2|nr:UvrD-helicase domain-containing protein [Niallia taxi]MED4055003.1 UvrD-helicase domain-containing protein [Niallia taxi]MED4119817.1 UvrD-helicase domain-containing protein [Niallia taxi]
MQQPMNMFNNADDHIDDLLGEFASLNNPKSFFLNAGAGAGKTRSLVNLLTNISKNSGVYLKKTNKKIAVITYTKVASEEIISRTPENNLFHISTIHSYVWNLIKGYNSNIKEALLNYCEKDIEAYTVKEKLTTNQKDKLNSLYQKRTEISGKRVFNYTPDSSKNEIGSLSHSDVLKIFCYLLDRSQLFRNLICEKYPVILIDECQDTNKDVLDAFLKLNQEHNICLGLFGDIMQRVYLDGKADLIASLKGLELPEKKVNWRSYGRIVKFTNKLRKNIDNLEQVVCNEERENKGLLKICLVNNDSKRSIIEEDLLEIIKREVVETNIDGEYSPYKLVLEHRLAAERNNFLNLFDAFKTCKDTDSAIDGESNEHTFFKQVIIPLYLAWEKKDDFSIHRLLNTYSHRFTKLDKNSIHGYKILQEVGNDLQEFLKIFNDTISVRKVCEAIQKSNLFEVPEKLRHNFDGETGWRAAFEIDFKELLSFYKYTEGISNIITQQGSKGLEYNHVQVIIDDYSVKGHLFSYEKLFGVKEKSSQDIKNEKSGKETTIHKTNRLFYVACSRAIKSLVLIIYTSNQQVVKDFFLNNEYVSEEEIIII